MSINWVMLQPSTPDSFVRLPGEKPIWKSSPRTSLLLSTPKSTYPAHNPNPLHISSSDGTLYLTNQRVVYLPKTPTTTFQSFSASLMNLHDTHIVVPWFGPNSWQAIVQPVPGGNIAPTAGGVGGIELKLTFKEGGAPDFEIQFNRIKERLQQVVDLARQSNSHNNGNQARGGGGAAVGGVNGLNLDSVHLDELPSYQASGHDRIAEPEVTVATTAGIGLGEGSIPGMVSGTGRLEGSATTNERVVEDVSRQSTNSQAPVDAPPGYEETQQQSIQAELDRRLSGQN